MSGPDMHNPTGPEEDGKRNPETNLSSGSSGMWRCELPEGIQTESFPTRDVLSVTTGRLLTKPEGPHNNGIGDLYKILDHMTGDQTYTHTIPRFSEECKPWLERWYPGLTAIESELQVLDAKLQEAEDKSQVVEKWLTDTLQKLGIPSELEIPKIPRDDHTTKNPLDELIEMRGSEEGIIGIQLEPQEPEDPADFWKKD